MMRAGQKYIIHRSNLRDFDIDMKSILINLAIIAALFFVNKLGLPGNAAFFACLVLMSISSAENSVKALSLLYLVLVGNTALVNTNSIVFSAGKFLLLFFICWRLLVSASHRKIFIYRSAVVKYLALFCTVSLILANLGGYFVEISALKLLSFFVGVVTCVAAAETMRGRSHRLNSWFLSIMIFVATLGIAAHMAGLGFNAKTDYQYFDRFFNGPFYHPNTTGPAAALAIIWLVGFCFLTNYQKRYWALLLMPIFLWFIYLSSARTSILALAFAGLILPFAGRAARDYGGALTKRLWRAAIISSLVFVFAALTLEAAQPGIIMNSAISFIVKGSRPEEASLDVDKILYSRQILIDMMVGNIEKNPWTGIGFGTSTHPAFVNNASILRATTEKGILPIAVIEEVGIIGGVFFIFFVAAFFSYCSRQKNIMGVMGFAALLGLNMTEMNFFAFGGHGGFFWIQVMACMILMPAPIAKISASPYGSASHRHKDAAAPHDCRGSA